MIKQASFVFYLWVIGGLAACSLPASIIPATSNQGISAQYETVSVMLTATAAFEDSRTITPSMLPTVTTREPRATDTQVPAIHQTVYAVEMTSTAAGPNTTVAESKPCDIAQPGRPIDVTVPDDTRFEAGEYFSKTWRLVNAGTCSWKSDYAVVWFSGDNVGLNHEQALGVEVQPGKSVDVTVDMVAPLEAGVYQSNWKMRSKEGNLFGIGPNGDAPFWVRIIVIPVDTSTPVPTELPPPPTQTPIALVQNTVILVLDSGVDFDPGSNQESFEDLVFKRSENGIYLLAPAQGAKLLPFGENSPGYDACEYAAVTEEAIAVEEFQPGTYFCYRTTEGLPGRLHLVESDLENNQVSLAYLTWAVP